jgi:outer membrane autotransporter protein
LRSFARVSGGYLTFDSDRFFLENDGTTSVSRTAKGSWNGTAMTGAAGLSYEVHSGSFSVRPAVSIDYVRLKENSYAETGGGAAFDLNLNSRTSHEEGVNGTLTVGYDIARAKTPDATQVRVELEGGRRELIGSSMGATTAHFAGGADFTLLPDSRDSGWLGRFRLLAGTQDFQAGGEIGSEEQQGHQAVSVRANVLVRF